MQFLYEVVTNENIILTVILATLIIRLATVFGDIKSRQSSLRMAAVQPQLDKLRKKYEKDQNRLAIEQRKFMKENNVSMFGGCLPMLITLPLFFIFIAAFRQWGQEMNVRLILALEENESAGLAMFEKFRFLWINNVWVADNGLKPVVETVTDFLGKVNAKLPNLLYFQDHPEALEKFVDLGFFVRTTITDGTSVSYTYALAEITPELTERYNALVAPCIELYTKNGVVYNNGWFVMPVLAGATTFLSSWIMTRKQPQNEAAGSTNKIFQWMMPLMTVWFCLSNNACFAVYWTFSNICSLITSLIINAAFEKKSKSLEEAKS